MIFFALLKTILYTDWISWFIHFFIFYTLVRWSGIKWTWALALIIGIEVWETVDWALNDPLSWWIRTDTWLDIWSGILGMALAQAQKRQISEKE